MNNVGRAKVTNYGWSCLLVVSIVHIGFCDFLLLGIAGALALLSTPSYDHAQYCVLGSIEMKHDVPWVRGDDKLWRYDVCCVVVYPVFYANGLWLGIAGLLSSVSAPYKIMHNLASWGPST